MVARIMILSLLFSFALNSMADEPAWMDYEAEKEEEGSGFQVEDIIRFTPYGVIAGLNIAGCEGRYNLSRLSATTGISNVILCGSVMALKKTVRESRPDGTSGNSFPSGHSAVAFAAATILHHEYGTTLSPWYSVGGYTAAVATAFLRLPHRRHFAHDVMVGAGIGVLSAEIGYMVSSLLFREKGICRSKRTVTTSPSPHFLDVEMGETVYTRRSLCVHPSITPIYCNGLSASAEGAFFLNRNIGIGGMIRLTSTPVKDGGEVVLDNLLDMSVDAGVYCSVPLSSKVSAGGKFLGGVRMPGSIGYTCRATTGRLNVGRGERMVAIDAKRSANILTGVSAEYRFRDNFSWKVYADIEICQTPYSTSVCLENRNAEKGYGVLRVSENINAMRLEVSRCGNRTSVGCAFTCRF